MRYRSVVSAYLGVGVRKRALYLKKYKNKWEFYSVQVNVTDI